MDFDRYQRQIQLPSFGMDGQEKLSQASVLIVGLGGLGCPAVQYLVGAGIGKIGLVDADQVSLSNLHRQTLYGTEDIGMPKVEIASQKLNALNPEINIAAYNEFITPQTVHSIASNYQYILDGTDQIETRYLLDAYCASQNKSYVYGSVYQFEGQVALFNYHHSQNMYKFLFPRPPKSNEVPTCGEHGILGFVPSIIGSMQALEIVKHICNLGATNSLVHYNALTQTIYKTLLPTKNNEVLLSLESLKNYSINDIAIHEKS